MSANNGQYITFELKTATVSSSACQLLFFCITLLYCYSSGSIAIDLSVLWFVVYFILLIFWKSSGAPTPTIKSHWWHYDQSRQRIFADVNTHPCFSMVWQPAAGGVPARELLLVSYSTIGWRTGNNMGGQGLSWRMFQTNNIQHQNRKNKPHALVGIE